LTVAAAGVDTQRGLPTDVTHWSVPTIQPHQNCWRRHSTLTGQQTLHTYCHRTSL